MAEKKKDSKKVKIEMSKLGLIFVILIILCIFVWSFIIGVWVGTKIGSKEQEATAFTKETPPIVEAQQPKVENNTSTAPAPEVLPPLLPAKKQVSQNNVTVPEHKVSEKKAIKPIHKGELKKLQSLIKPSHHEKTQEKKVTKHKVEKKKSSTKHKAVHKTPYYGVQIGAFSKFSSAKAEAAKFRKKGYHVVIKKVHLKHGKVLYKVIVGRYHRRRDAEVAIIKIKQEFGVKGFVVEVK